MVIFASFAIVCWIIFVAYWTVSARNLKPVKETKLKVKGFWWNICLIFIVLLAFLSAGIPVSVYPLSVTLFPSSQVLGIISYILVILGLSVAISARRELADNWSRDAVYKKDHKLITTGIYGYLRHPIYSGILLMLLGIALFTRATGVLSIFLILLAVFVFRLKNEEELLTKHFPKEYPQYRKKVKTLIPFVW